jgi:hypothetical protein
MKMRNAVITAALSAPLVLLAGDFWRDKEPAQWSSDEVSQMLTKSPWARQVSASPNQSGDSQDSGRGGGMGRGGGGWGGQGGGGGMGGGGWGGQGGGGGMGGGGWGGQGGQGGGGGMGGGGWGGRGGGGGGRRGPEGMQAVKVTVRWESAAPVHEALLKSEVADASKFADWSKDYYVITVNGLPQMGQRRRDNDDDQQQDPDREKEMQDRMKDRMKQNTSLKVSDRTIAPERVEMLDSPAGRTMVFLFPRTANILPGDKEVAFVSAMGRMEIRSKFALKEMVFRGKLEL